jgi:hypothetical protein
MTSSPMAFATSFHWGAPADPTWREPARFVDVCRRAASAGFESIDIPHAPGVAEAIALAVAAAGAIPDLRFRVTCAPPASLLGAALADERVKDTLKDAVAALERRLILHVKINDDDCVRDDDVAEAAAALESCRRLFADSAGPELDVEGQAAEAAFLAIRHADRLWRRPASPTMVDADAWPVLHFGTEVGLIASVVARETASEALAAASDLLPDAGDLANDSASWIAPWVWGGGGAAPNARTVFLIGSFDEVAQAIHRYVRGGISSFLIRGWGRHDVDDREMSIVGTGVLPLVRRRD